jgi:4-amino-4-deoxy-L-arabinose transferase-like glycosyltransferase
VKREFEHIATLAGWMMVALVTGYWLAYILVAPVTTADSHIYNLSRLLIAERGGLFGNPPWTNLHQIVFPWSFDTVHLPFLKLGRLENLPSFLCLLGIVLVGVLLCARQGILPCAPLVALVLLASPTVAFQATTSKNDLAVAFFALAAFYFLQLYHEAPNRRLWLIAFVVSLGMCAGAKTTGLALAALLLAAAMVLRARQGIRPLEELLLASTAALAVCGSVETYANNVALFGAWMGKPDFIAAHANPDGLRGAVANAIRYAFNSLGTGLESEALTRDYRGWLTNACNRFLGGFGLAGAGLAPMTGGDSRFLLGAHEVASNYGLVGLASLPLALVALWRERLREPAGRLAAFGLAALALVCITAGWQKFNMRLLLPSAVPILLSATLFAAPALQSRAAMRFFLQLLLFLLAAAVPLCSWNRTPKFIRWAWRDRETVALQERLPLLAEWKGVRTLARSSHAQGCAVILGPEDWALPYLQDRQIRWAVVPNLEARPSLTRDDLLHGLPRGASGEWLLLASQGCAAVALPVDAQLLATFPDAGRVYLWNPGAKE